MQKSVSCDSIHSYQRGDFMTLYEKGMMEAQNNDKVIFYDYISYKRAAGWWTGLIGTDWNRPREIQRAKYNSEFLQSLPDYYFLGLPIKELLKSTYASGRCHACAIALSLFFKDFEIVTCNLKNYVEHYTIKSKNNIYDYREINEYEHTFLLIELDGQKTVIDTTWGFITDYETYSMIFNPDKIRTITSELLNNVEPYQYIKSLKNYKVDLKCFHQIYIEEKNEWVTTEEEKEFDKIMHSYMDMCTNYTNNKNSHLQDFINRCLFRTSNSTCHWDWRCTLEYRKRKIEYPTTNLFSLEDDEFDTRIESEYPETIERNKRILESYHKAEIPEIDSNEEKIGTNSLIDKIKTKSLNLVRTLKNRTGR